MKHFKKYLLKPSTLIRYIIIIAALTLHAWINPYNGINRSRYDLLFWTKQWNIDTVLILIIFIVAGSLIYDYVRLIKKWLKDIL